jgi:hypothetical protein
MSQVMRCKLQLHRIETTRVPNHKVRDSKVVVDGEARSHKVAFGGVWDGSPEAQAPSENAIFGEMTPMAEFKATIKNEAVAASLIPGKKYYVTFTEAPD